MHAAPTTVPVDGRAVKYLSENRDRYRAMSILHGFVPDPLPATVEEARDVIRWHAEQYAREASPLSEAEYVNQLREGAAFKYGSNT